MFTLYAVVAVFGAICFISPGIIHPDEYMQSLQVVARDMYPSTNQSIPWEFASDTKLPIRSIVFPYLMVYPGMKLLQLAQPIPSSPIWIVAATRLVPLLMLLCSFYMVYRLAEEYDSEHGFLLFLCSSSAWVYCVRSFTNSFEAFLTISMMYLVELGGNYSPIKGIILALGMFCRPTFPIFVFTQVMVGMPTSQGNCAIIRASVRTTLGFLSTSMVIMLIDSLYYGHLWTITPYNFVEYNLDNDKLAQHGTHPWYLHPTLNMLIMFGPLWLEAIFWFLFTMVDRDEDNMILILATLAPLSVLSMIPHQEVRFLLPLSFPLYLYVGKFSGKSSLILHCIYQILISLFFCNIHQGGLLHAAAETVDHFSDSQYPVTVLSACTFTPPSAWYLPLQLKGINVTVNAPGTIDLGDIAIPSHGAVYLPAHFHSEFTALVGNRISEIITVMYHLSMECLPKSLKEPDLAVYIYDMSP